MKHPPSYLECGSVFSGHRKYSLAFCGDVKRRFETLEDKLKALLQKLERGSIYASKMLEKAILDTILRQKVSKITEKDWNVFKELASPQALFREIVKHAEGLGKYSEAIRLACELALSSSFKQPLNSAERVAEKIIGFVTDLANSCTRASRSYAEVLVKSLKARIGWILEYIENT